MLKDLTRIISGAEVKTLAYYLDALKYILNYKYTFISTLFTAREMENGWRSGCFDSVTARRRTAQADHCHKKGNVGSAGGKIGNCWRHVHYLNITLTRQTLFTSESLYDAHRSSCYPLGLSLCCSPPLCQMLAIIQTVKKIYKKKWYF